MEISNPSMLTKGHYVAVFFDGGLVGNARDFTEYDGVYSSTYEYNGVSYTVEYRSDTYDWTAFYPEDLYNTYSRMFLVYCYNETVQVQSPLNAEYIPVDNNTITVNNGVLVASGGSGGGTTYTAGTGIEIFNDEISVDTDVIPVKADLANYATQTQLTNGLATKQDTLTNGTGVYINNNQITVDVMALLNAGTGITLSDYDNSISIDNSVVALKSDIPAANTYGDADVADYISDTFGMGVSGAEPTLWGQTSDPQYIGEDSTAEITLTGSGSTDPFQGGGNTQYPVEFEIRQNSNDELVSSVNDTFLSQFTGSEYSPVYHFSSEDGNKSFDLGYYSDAWWLSETTVSGYSQGYHVSNFMIYLPTSGTVKIPIDEDFIPSTIARVSDIPADELPTIASGDAGKVLTVNSGETGVEWTTISRTNDTLVDGPIWWLFHSGQVSDFYFGTVPTSSKNWTTISNNLRLKGFAAINGGNGGIFNTTPKQINDNCGTSARIYKWNSDLTHTSYPSTDDTTSLNAWNTHLYLLQTDSNSIHCAESTSTLKNVFAYNLQKLVSVPVKSDIAASAIYLKDTNNVVYQITVDTSGNLVATAV